jgi:lipopolysaccharide/colanic/teichoic acid biosynthesis glycosyltransferase
MYRAGFEVVDEAFRHGEFFVLAHKVKEPIWDDVPSGSPLIKLKRVGKDKRLIGVYKFRTMYSYSEYLQPYVYEHNHLQQGGKFANDYRVTPWGKWMRKLWIDELPMIINFLKGDMKLVGVRPLSRHYFSLYTKEMQELRTKVKPGLLPPFYYERQTPNTIEEVQDSERRYIEAYLKHPFLTDMKYFFGTIGNILFRRKTSH